MKNDGADEGHKAGDHGAEVAFASLREGEDGQYETEL